MDCQAKLEKYFRENGVHYQTLSHPPAYTAQEIAAAQHVPGKQVAKVVMVTANSRPVMLVLPASHHIDFRKLGEALGMKNVRLAHESEFESLFPDCDLGAMPPFGNLYGVRVCADETLAEDAEIVFQAGAHDTTMKIAYSDFVRLANPIVADFAAPMHVEWSLPAH